MEDNRNILNNEQVSSLETSNKAKNNENGSIDNKVGIDAKSKSFSNNKNGENNKGKRFFNKQAKQNKVLKENVQEKQNEQTNTNTNANNEHKKAVVEYTLTTHMDKLTKLKNTTNKNKKLKVVFLGGVGEIGKNMYALEYEDDIIVIDSGLTFPDDEMPGIDIVVPDITYLVANREKVRGIVLTHGHEDHIGGLPYVLNEIPTSIYGSKLTIALVENKMKEHKKVKYGSKIVKAGQKIKLGCFEIEFINVNHSISGAFAVAVSTPVGMVVHTGDFKIDFSPIKGETTDLTRLAEIGKKGVQLMLCESTNVERKGYSMSERSVGETLDKLFEAYKEKRLIVATFASNVHRLQQIMDLAEKYGRKIVFSGRSMINVAETALKIGEMTFNKNIIIDVDSISKYKNSELLIVSTGSQGEPMSALSRMANDDFPKVKLTSEDCVIISASPIPGNEKSVYNVINNLYKKGCVVIYHELADVHVSGHACQDELRIMHNLVKPKFFIPIHGEYRHLKLHKDLAVSMGMEERNVFIADLGNVVEFSHNAMTQAKDITSGSRLIDGYGVGDKESTVIRDRKQLEVDGVCVAVLHIDDNSKKQYRMPDLLTRGFIYNDEQSEVIGEARKFVFESLQNSSIKSMDRNEIRAFVRKNLTNYFVKKVNRKPVIIVC